MSNTYFQFKQFRIEQSRSAMKVTTDACLFGAWAAKKISALKNINDLVDAGAGTGLLSMMIAQKSPNIHIDAIEIDDEAAEQARENVLGSAYSERIKVTRADILSHTSRQYDILVSNPPFFENDLQSGDARRNAALHATELSLSDLLEYITMAVKKEGYFFLLLGYRRIHEFETYLENSRLRIIEKVIVRQSVNHKPFRVMLYGSLTEKDIRPFVSEISIVNADKKYSGEFTSLLQDYYLNL